MTTKHASFSRRAFLGGAAAFGASMMVPSIAFAEPTSAEKQAEADAVRVKLDDMQTRLETAANDYYDALDEHDAAAEKMEAAQTRIGEYNARIAELQERLGGRARDMYRNGRTTFLDIVLGSATFEDFIKNWDALKAMNQQDADLVSQTKELREANEVEKKEYADQASIAQQKMEEADAIRQEAEALVEEYQAEVDSLDAEVAELVEKERQAAAAAEAERLARELEEQRQREAEEEAARQAAEEEERRAAEAAAEAERQAQAEEEEQEYVEEPEDDDSEYEDDSEDDEYDDGGEDDGGDDNGGENFGSYSGGGTPNYAAVGVAESCLGVPYVWGGSDPATGLDCSGLTSYCYAMTGYSIPHQSEAQYSSATYVMPLSQAEPGDVLYKSGHVGLCTASGGGEYIHAPRPGEVVCYASWSLFYAALRW